MEKFCQCLLIICSGPLPVDAACNLPCQDGVAVQEACHPVLARLPLLFWILLTRVDGERYGVQGSERRAAGWYVNDDGDGGGDGSSVVRHAAARTGLRWCGTRRHERVFGGAARSGTNGSVSGTVLSGTIGYVTGGGGDAGGRKARGGCIVERLRGEERNTPPRSLFYLPQSCAHTAQSSHSPGASPRGPTYLHC